jgi:hypothetical protein
VCEPEPEPEPEQEPSGREEVEGKGAKLRNNYRGMEAASGVYK